MPSACGPGEGRLRAQGSQFRPGMGEDAMLGRGCLCYLPQQPGRPRLRLAHSHPHTLQRLPTDARGSRGNWLGLTQNCIQQLFPYTCRGKWGGGKMHPLLSSSLFPWEAESTVFGCVVR